MLARFFARIGAGISLIVKSIGPREAAMLFGLSMLGYGAGYIYWPAGFIAPAAVMLYVAIAGLD